LNCDVAFVGGAGYVKKGRGRLVDSTCPLVGMWSDLCPKRCQQARV